MDNLFNECEQMSFFQLYFQNYKLAYNVCSVIEHHVEALKLSLLPLGPIFVEHVKA